MTAIHNTYRYNPMNILIVAAAAKKKIKNKLVVRIVRTSQTGVYHCGSIKQVGQSFFFSFHHHHECNKQRSMGYTCFLVVVVIQTTN